MIDDARSSSILLSASVVISCTMVARVWRPMTVAMSPASASIPTPRITVATSTSATVKPFLDLLNTGKPRCVEAHPLGGPAEREHVRCGARDGWPERGELDGVGPGGEHHLSRERFRTDKLDVVRRRGGFCEEHLTVALHGFSPCAIEIANELLGCRFHLELYPQVAELGR